jgi:hypothetical protein
VCNVLDTSLRAGRLQPRSIGSVEVSRASLRECEIQPRASRRWQNAGMRPLSLVLILFAALHTGCAISLPGAALGAPEQSGSVPARAWLARVEIRDPTLKNRDEVRDALTLQIRTFLEEGSFFDDVRLLPGQPQDGDFILRFDFKHFYQIRDVDPWYFPLSLVTFGWYPIFGGSVFVDASNLAGTLIIESPAGTELASSSSEVERRDHVGVWSPNYVLPSGIDPRTKIVQALVDEALQELPANGGQR